MSMIEIQYERCGRRRRGASPQIAPSGADNRVRGDQHGMAACSTFRLTRETPMTTNLRQRMTDDVQVRNLSLPTQSSYVQQVSMFARAFRQIPGGLGDRRHPQLPALSDQSEEAKCQLDQSRCLGNPISMSRYPGTAMGFRRGRAQPKKPRTLPIILSPEEIVHFLGCVANSSACRRWSRCPRQRTRTIATSTKNSLASHSASALLAARPYGVAPRPSAVHPGSIDHRHVMTTQQALPTASAPR